MGKYVIRRLLLAIPTLLGATLALFLLVRFLPGSVIDELSGQLAGSIAATPETRARIKHELGLDRPIAQQYVTWLMGVARGDFGDRLGTGQPVAPELRRRFGPTLELAMLSFVLTLVAGIPLGVAAAVKSETPVDYAVRTVAVAGLSVPYFWSALIFIIVASRQFNWTPPLQYAGPLDDFGKNMQSVLIPALLLSTFGVASVMKLVRTSMLEVLREDYVRTARAKGLRDRAVVYRHALKNALIPVITLAAALIPGYLGGTIVLESIFNIPGVGTYLFTGISRRDYPIVQAVNLIFVLVVIIVNLSVDLAYSYLDPRIRLGGGHGA